MYEYSKNNLKIIISINKYIKHTFFLIIKYEKIIRYIEIIVYLNKNSIQSSKKLSLEIVEIT